MNYITTFSQLFENVDTKEIVKDFINDSLRPAAKSENEVEALSKIEGFFDTNQPTMEDVFKNFTLKENANASQLDFASVLDKVKTATGIDFNNIITSQNLVVGLYAILMLKDSTGLTKWPLVVTSYINYKKEQNELNLITLILTIISALPLGLGPGIVKGLLSTVGTVLSIIPGGFILGLLLAPIALASSAILSLAPYFALLQAPKALNDSVNLTEQNQLPNVDPKQMLQDIVDGSKYFYEQAMNMLQNSGIMPVLASVGTTITNSLSNFFQSVKTNAEQDPLLFPTKDKPSFWQRMSKQTTPTQYGGFKFPRGKAG
jgi:hypothetical protein